MTPVERQEYLQKLMNSFNKTVFKATAVPGAAVPFEFTYEGDLDMEYFTLGCGCTSAEVIQTGNGLKEFVIKGVVNVDDLATIRRVSPKGDVWTKHASISVYFDDGIEPFLYHNFERKFNSNKVAVNLDIQIEVKL